MRILSECWEAGTSCAFAVRARARARACLFNEQALLRKRSVVDAVVCGKTVHALRMTFKGRTRSAGNFARGRLVRIGALKRAPFEHGAFGRPQTSCQKRFQKRKPMQKINFFACGSRATKPRNPSKSNRKITFRVPFHLNGITAAPEKMPFQGCRFETVRFRAWLLFPVSAP